MCGNLKSISGRNLNDKSANFCHFSTLRDAQRKEQTKREHLWISPNMFAALV